MLTYGDHTTIHAFIQDRLWMVQSVIVVQDTPNETWLLLEVGAECLYPSGYWRWKRGNTLQGSRWDDVKSGAWTLRKFTWHTHRLLIQLVPERYFATYLIWDAAEDQFTGYYINFQTPFQRTVRGFQTMDLELDIVIKPDFTWSYKDEEHYALGLHEGCITPVQEKAIECLKPDVFAMIYERRYPLDGSWVNWRPEPDWTVPRLRDEWEGYTL
jgi:hypothetical protein